MNFATTEWSEGIERGLRSRAAKLSRPTNASWSLQYANGERHRLDVRHDEGWLRFTAGGNPPADSAAPGEHWPCLLANAALADGLRWTIDASRNLSLRADLPLLADVAIEDQVRGVVRGFERMWKKQTSAGNSAPAEDASPCEALFEEAGWPCVRRASGRVTVALDLNPPVQATVATVGGGLRVGAEVADLTGYSLASRRAVAALALELTSQFYLVRASADAPSAKLCFEVGWPTRPDAAELHAGLAALSAARRAAGESCAALAHEQLAQDYLTVRGWTAATSTTKQQPERTST